MDPVVSDVVGAEPTVTPVKKWWSMSRDMKILGMVVMVVGLGLGLLVVQQGTSVPMAARLRPRPTLAPRPSTPTQACPSGIYKYDGIYSNAPLANRAEVSSNGEVYVPFGQKVLKYSAAPTPTITWAGKCKGGDNCRDFTPDVQLGHSDKFNCVLNNGTSCITPVPADPHEYDWQFKDARSATLDGNGYAYVADFYAHRVARLGLNDGTYAYIGKCLGNVGGSTACNVPGQFANGFVCNNASCTRNFAAESGLGDRQFTNPAGVKAAGNQLFVTDNRNNDNRVKLFGMSGDFVRSWNVDYAQLLGYGPLTETVGGIDVQDGRVFVASNAHFDPWNTTLPDYWSGVMVYNIDGSYIQRQQVVSTRNLSDIRTVDVDETGTVYVAYSTLLGGVGGWGLQHYRYEPQSIPPAPTPIVYTPRQLQFKKYTTGSNYQNMMLCDNKGVVSVDSGATLYISSTYDPYDPGTEAYCDSSGYPVVNPAGVMKFVCDGGVVPSNTPTPTSTVPTNTPTRTPTPTQPQVSPTPTPPVTLEICQNMEMGPAGVSSNNDVQWYFVNNNANKYLHSVWLSWPTPVPPNTTPYIMNIQHYGSTVAGNPATIWTGNVITSPFNNSTWIAGRDRIFGSTFSILAINLNDAARAGHYTLVTRWALTPTGPAVCQSSPSTWVR